MSLESYELRKFVAPEFIYGVGARHLAPQYIKNLKCNKVLVVTDVGIEETHWLDELCFDLDAQDIKYYIYNNVTPNPKDKEVMQGAEFYRSKNCDAILALGGGSPMDCAKGIGIVVSNGYDILSYEGVDNVRVPAPPMIFIPSTAGTASDVSQFAIINASERMTKIAIVSKAIIPDVALIDPEITTTMDDYEKPHFAGYSPPPFYH